MYSYKFAFAVLWYLSCILTDLCFSIHYPWSCFSEANPSSVWMRCNSDEVSATRWISRSELDSLVRSDSSDGYSIHNQWTLDSLTPWFRTLLTTGLLHRVWDWAEAYWNRQSDSLRFKSENQQWDRDRIYRLSCS